MTTNKIQQVLPLFGGGRLEGGNNSKSMSTIVGTATSDSKDGFVDVIIGDTAITEGDDGISVGVPTSVKVIKGDSVIITRDGNGVIKKPTVTDVLGGGDRQQADIDAAANAAAVAEQAAEQAKKVSDEAQAAVEATNQHFYSDDNGVHVTTGEGEESESEGPNLLANSQGIMLRNGKMIMSAQTPSGFTIYNSAVDPIAIFGETVVIGGENDGGQLVMDNDSIDLLINSGLAMHIGIALSQSGTLVPTYSFSGTATAAQSFADSMGTAQGWGAHADSSGTATAGGDHADSNGTASGGFSHASAYGTAKGNGSFATCNGTAENTYSAAIGNGTLAGHNNEVAVGKYNLDTADDTIFVVGNGTSDSNRSNAMRVTTSGDIGVSGNVRAGGQVLDTITSGTAAMPYGFQAGSSCRWIKTGHVVQVKIWAKLPSSLATYSAINTAFTGLPKAYSAGETGILKIDNSTGTCFPNVGTDGVLKIVTRETAIAANGVVTGGFTYISSE